MKKVLILLVVLALVGSVSAAIKVWSGELFAAGTGGDWTAPDHWTTDGTTPTTTPGPADHAIIYGDTWVDPGDILPFPTISTDVGTVDILSPSWHDNIISFLTVAKGGKIETTGFMRLGAGANSHTTLNIDGGTVVANILQAGDNGAGTGTGAAVINLNAGVLDTETSSFYNAVLDIEVGAYFLLDGDRTTAVQTWVNDGKITAMDGVAGGTVAWDYDVTVPGRTAVWAQGSGIPLTLKTWAGGVFGSASDEWMLGTTNQWADENVAAVTPPDANSYAIILDDVYGVSSLLPYPVIRSDVGTANYLGVSLHSDTTAELTIESGGRLAVAGAATIAGDELGNGNSYGTVNIDGGTLLATHLSIGSTYGTTDKNGIGQININAGGELHAGSVDYVSTSSNIDLELGAYFYIAGDVTSLLQPLVDPGMLSSTDGDGTTHLEWDYDVTVPGQTTIWVAEGPGCSSYLVSDINEDCVTNLKDFAILASEWLLSGL